MATVPWNNVPSVVKGLKTSGSHEHISQHVAKFLKTVPQLIPQVSTISQLQNFQI